MAVLAFRGGTDFPAQLVRDELQSIADAQHWRSHGEHTRVSGRRVMVINRTRATAQNNAGWPIAFDFFQRSGTGQDSGKDFQFTDAARNQLCVLRTEVKNYDG